MANSNQKNNRARWILLAVLVLAGAGVLTYWLLTRAYESTDNAFIEGDIIQISPRVAGQVTRVHVSDNQHVNRGDLLLEIDPHDYEARLAEARGKLGDTMARSSGARYSLELTSTVSGAVLIQARAAADAAREQLGVLKARLAQDEARIHGAEAGSGQAEARRVAAEAKAAQASTLAVLRQAELNLSYTRIFAPDSGYITRKSVQPGNFVQVGQALMALVSGRLGVIANFKETQLTLMRPGQPASIKIDAYPERKFRGRVDSIQSGSGARFSLLPPENATGNYVKVVQRVPLKILFDETPPADCKLGPGMSVVPEVKVR
jgi:membrane fusion protein (multidrug efflux system)